MLQFKRMRFHLLGVLLLSVGLGCTADRDARSTVLEKDSAGIRIIETSVPAWREAEAWVISSQPVLQIGTREGDQSTQLFQVQDAARRSDGVVVVVNLGSGDVRLYSSDGRHIRTVGRKGSGPGEFRDPRKVWVIADDSLVVMDWTRVSVFDSSGTFVRSTQIGPWPLHERFDDGSFLKLVIPPGMDAFLPGYTRPDLALVRSLADGTAADTLARLAGDELFRSTSDAGGVSSYRAPFGIVRSAAVHGDSVYTGDGTTFDIWDLDSDGALARIIRRHSKRTPVTPATTESYEARMLEGATTDAGRRRLERLFREWTYPSFEPSYDDLRVDHEGDIWARHYAIGSIGSRWSIFDSAGRWLGSWKCRAASVSWRSARTTFWAHRLTTLMSNMCISTHWRSHRGVTKTASQPRLFTRG